MARRHSSKEVVTPPPPPPPPATPNLHPGLTGGRAGGWDGRLCYPVKVWLFPKSRQTRKKGPRRPGEGIGGAAQRVVGHVHPFVAHRGKGKEEGKRPGPLLAAARTAAPFFFVCRCCPALPVMRIIPASAGWQAQHGLCSGSGSGISTRAKGLCPGHGAGDARFVSTL